jgi:hypothetical protein
MKHVTRRFTIIAAAALTAACASEGALSDAYTVRDSAGIRIVESIQPTWGVGEGWTVTAEPVLHIGVADGGAEEYRFTVIAGPAQHGGTWQLGDGTIVAADFGTRQVRRYAADGTFMNAWGRRGDGPGEFQQFQVLPYRGDSILVIDVVRYSFYDREGSLGRMVTVDLREVDVSGARPRPIAATGLQLAFDDGSFLAIRNPAAIFTPGECQSSERIFFRFDAQGQLADTIGVYPAPDRCFPDPASGLLSLPFDQEFVFTTHGTDVYVGGVDGFEVRRVSVEGSQTLIRAAHLDLTTTDAHRSGYRDNAREVVRANNMDMAAAERALLEVEYPPTVPAFSQLMVDSDGHLWVRHYKQRWAGGPETWSVFAPEGHLLGTVDTPESLQVRQIERDFILGIWTDELEIRYVRKYGLLRN